MSTSFKHLLIIRDGEIEESSLHLTERERAQRLITLLKANELHDDEVTPSEVDTVLEEADIEASQADYPEGTSFTGMRPEDYTDALRDLLSNNGFDLHLEDISTPTTT